MIKENTYRRRKYFKLSYFIGALFLLFCLFYAHQFLQLNQIMSASSLRNNDNKKGSSKLLIPNEFQISAIVMNYSRPKALQRTSQSSLLATLSSHNHVNEVLLLHANPLTKFDYIHDKVHNIDASKENEEMGLAIRFHFCATSMKNNQKQFVLFVDDDMEFPSESLDELIIEFRKDTKRIVGKWGRDFNVGLLSQLFYNGYNTYDRTGQVDVVLTKFMLMEKQVCKEFMKKRHLVEYDIVQAFPNPLWNGEDIFASLLSSQMYQRKNFAMPWLEVHEFHDPNDENENIVAISGGYNGNKFPKIWSKQYWQSIHQMQEHFRYRGRLWTKAKARLATTVKV